MNSDSEPLAYVVDPTDGERVAELTTQQLVDQFEASGAWKVVHCD
jgi:hypothetical protein